MKIEWLNDDKTEARVTKGWFRKRSAIVYIEVIGGYWRFRSNREQVGWWVDMGLDDARKKAVQASPWIPVEPLPRARLLRGDQ
jgi:hypothetical protein